MTIQSLIDALESIKNKHKTIWIDKDQLIVSGSGDQPINLNEDLEIE